MAHALHICRPQAYIGLMKRLMLPLALLLASPAAAQDDNSQLRDGFDLFGEATRMILEGLVEEMEPMLEEIQPFIQDDMIPFFQNLGEQIDDLSHYELPERLPNGDIIIRRSPDAPPWGDAPVGEVEL